MSDTQKWAAFDGPRGRIVIPAEVGKRIDELEGAGRLLATQLKAAGCLLNLVKEKFTSGNSVDVERITLTREEWIRALAGPEQHSSTGTNEETK